ncbi:MAG TPA: hypothetical protein VMT67_01735 [Terriglobales bacterium]|nr:hypothetical protein [Terriglobales bacterium]
MGYAVSWLAFQNQAEDEVLALLGLQRTRETQEVPEGDWCIGRIGAWTIVWSNAYEPKSSREVMSRFKGTFIICDIEEHVMFVSTACYDNGNRSWRIVHDAQKSPAHLVAEGDLPESFGRIKGEELARAGESPDVDFNFEIPVRVAEEIIGFRHDSASPSVFEVLRPISASKRKLWPF